MTKSITQNIIIIIVFSVIIAVFILIVASILGVSYIETFQNTHIHVGDAYTLDGVQHILEPVEHTKTGQYPIIKHKLAKTLKQIYTDFEQICSLFNIKIWIAYGTLLGCIRHKGFIPWDDDMDVQILQKDLSIIAGDDFQSQLENVGLVCKQSLLMPSVLRITRTSGYEFIDVFSMDGREEKLFACGDAIGHTCTKAWDNPARYYQNNQLFPLQRTVFEDISVWMPNKPLDILEIEYGKHALTEYRITHNHIVCLYIERLFILDWNRKMFTKKNKNNYIEL